MIKKIAGTVMVATGMTIMYLTLSSKMKRDIIMSQLSLKKQMDTMIEEQDKISQTAEYTSSRVDNIENDIEDIQDVINEKVLGIKLDKN